MVRNIDPDAQALQIVAPQQISQRTIPLLERQIDDAMARRVATVDISFRASQIIDSAGLNWLLNTQSRLGSIGCTLRLAELPPIIADALLATRLDTRFPIQPLVEGSRNA